MRKMKEKYSVLVITEFYFAFNNTSVVITKVSEIKSLAVCIYILHCIKFNCESAINQGMAYCLMCIFSCIQSFLLFRMLL